jgi:DNA-binding IclR family transcriptional regulator
MDLVHVQIREAALVVAVVRILVAIEPQMYGEVLAFHIRQERPLSEVVLASSQTLWAEAERARPHLIVANEVPPKLKQMCFWVEVRTEDRLVATISADGYSTTIDDVSLQELLAVVDKTEEQLAHDEA